jgi:hypothetical protein
MNTRRSSQPGLGGSFTPTMRSLFLIWAAFLGGGFLLWNWFGKTDQFLKRDLDSTRSSVQELSESVKAGNSAFGEVGQLRADTQSVLNRLETLEKGLAGGPSSFADDGPSRQAVEGARVATLAAQAAGIRERLQKLKSLEANWRAKSATLLTGDLGRRIVASPAHLELVVDMLRQELPTADHIRHWELELLPLATPVEQSAREKRSYLAITPQHTELLANLEERVTGALQTFESQQLLLEAIEKETAHVTSGKDTLEKLIGDRRRETEKANAQRLAIIREAARTEAEQAQEKRAAQLEHEVVAAEAKLRDQKLLTDKNRLEQQAKADAEQAAEEARVNEAKHRAILIGLKDEAKRVDDVVRLAQLEREFERIRPQVVEYLSAFTRDGFVHRADGTKGPVSLSFIDGQGALEPNRNGYEKLSRLMSYGNDRPHGPIPHHIELFGQPRSLAPIEKAQEYLKKYGQIMVSRGLLAR